MNAQQSGREQVPGEVRDRLRAAASSVRPAGPVAPLVRAAVRRRRRRRVAGAGALSAALVAGVVGVAVALPGGGPGVDPAASPTPSDAAPTAASTAAFSCATESRVFGEAPPIPDLAEQQATARTLRGLSSIQVRHAEPTHLGVVALVVDDSDDQDYRADQEVVDRLTGIGAALVYEWDPSASEAGVDEHGQVRQVLQWQLDPVVRDVRSATRGIPGDAGLALWQEAAAVLLQWKAPVPDEVQALAGRRESGVEVIVEGVTYSRADVRRAQSRLVAWLESAGRRDDWSTAYACADGSGLVVGMVPDAADERGLAGEIEEAVGMPVLVVPEERPVEMLDREAEVGR